MDPGAFIDTNPTDEPITSGLPVDPSVIGRKLQLSLRSPQQATGKESAYFSFAHSGFASFKMGTSRCESFQNLKKSL